MTNPSGLGCEISILEDVISPGADIITSGVFRLDSNEGVARQTNKGGGA
jgi:hypothetical protein